MSVVTKEYTRAYGIVIRDGKKRLRPTIEKKLSGTIS